MKIVENEMRIFGSEIQRQTERATERDTERQAERGRERQRDTERYRESDFSVILKARDGRIEQVEYWNLLSNLKVRLYIACPFLDVKIENKMTIGFLGHLEAQPIAYPFWT